MTKAPPFTDRIPEVLENLHAVAAAILTTEGSLEASNAGFRRLVDQLGTEHEGQLLAQPSLAELSEGPAPDGWTLVHEGLVNVGGPQAKETVSLDGTVHRKGDRLVLLAEHDPDRQRELREKVLDLNQDLTETQREMKAELKLRQEAEEELRQQREALERSNELLQEFAYVVSHDLQEPLRMVRSYLQLLERRYEGELDEEAHEFIDYAVDGAKRMGEMIQALLEYSRVQSRGKPPTNVDVREVLDDVLDSLRVRVEETGAQIEAGGMPEVQADEGQLGHVFQNLLENALKYGGDPPRIEIGSEPADDGFVRLWVADEGPGIPENERENLFGIFERGADAKGPGTGIGLAICKRIVERHGGEIGVESTPGEGATFWFTLPGPDAEVEIEAGADARGSEDGSDGEDEESAG